MIWSPLPFRRQERRFLEQTHAVYLVVGGSRGKVIRAPLGSGDRETGTLRDFAEDHTSSQRGFLCSKYAETVLADEAPNCGLTALQHTNVGRKAQR